MAFGPPDVEGSCNAWYVFGGDYGDEDSHIFRCDLPARHAGHHKETWKKVPDGNEASLEWVSDERPEIERQEEYENGASVAWGDENPVPEEPGEAYLEGFVQGVLDREAYDERQGTVSTTGDDR
jgi:hypothetical protein